MHPVQRTPFIVAAGLAASLALGACSSHDATSADGSGHGPMGTASHPAAASSQPASGQGAPGDVMFAQMMIPHHQQAVEMAELALQKPDVSAEVRALAEQIRAAQAPEIDTMTGWLASWGAAPTASSEHQGHGMEGMMSDSDLKALAAAEGKAFDRSWLTMMIAHHEGAVTMSRAVLSTTSNPQVRTLADAIVASQQEEISAMRGLIA